MAVDAGQVEQARDDAPLAEPHPLRVGLNEDYVAPEYARVLLVVLYSDAALLRVNGIEEEPRQEDSVLRITKCVRCETDNSPTNRFCSKCGTPLDLRTAIELQDEEKTTDNVMNMLMEDREFKELVGRKLSQLAMTPAPRQ